MTRKRLLDLALLLPLVPLFAAVTGLLALAVLLADGRPVFFHQPRVGQGQRPFTVWKLRTMTCEPDPQQRKPTRLGAWLRQRGLDELPQLWNVLVGEMSLVGPRPERPGFVQQHLAGVPGYAERFAAPPGLTGLAQVNGEYHSTAENKLRYDLAYISNRSLWLDLSILVRTVRIVLTSQGV